MAVSTGYVVRETAVNIRRNVFLTVAAVLTTVVSLTVVGSVKVMQQMIDKAAVQWKGGVELSIFLQPGVTDTERDAIAHQLQTMQTIKKVRYVDKPAAYAEFKSMFANTPELVNSLGVADMPPSFRVVPFRAEDVQTIGDHFKITPGVKTVVYAKDIINSLLKNYDTKHKVAIIMGAVWSFGAVALIVITIQLAIFARRREIAVMKLVGATNWFIRIPFMIEGVIDGIVGAVFAGVACYFGRRTIASFVSSSPVVGNSVGALYVTNTEALYTGVLLIAAGALVGAIGSAFAVRRFLAV